jgi:hypothetical protein
MDFRNPFRMRRCDPGRAAVWVSGALALLSMAVLGAATRATSPTGAEVMEQALLATGGREAHAKLHNRVTRGFMEMPAMGLKATMTAYAAAPNLAYALFESPALGKIESGANGGTCWEISMMAGPRILDGDERAAVMRESVFNNTIHWKELYRQAETIGIDSVNGEACYKVLLTPNEGQPETHYFAVDSHLLLKAETTISSSMGSVKVETYPSDYREVDGVLIAHTSRQVIMGLQQMVIKSESVEHNVTLPEGIFDLPADIRALVDR